MHIKTTRIGFAKTYFWCVILLCLAASAWFWVNGLITTALMDAGVNSIAEINRWNKPDYVLLNIVKWITITIGTLIFAGLLHTIFYDSVETNELVSQGENWSRIERKTYWFPIGRETKGAVVNRVTEVTVNENSFDRIFGTGSLTLKLTVFLNATEAQMDWTIPAIKDPHKIAEEIRSKSLDHDGARVTLQRIDRE